VLQVVEDFAAPMWGPGYSGPSGGIVHPGVSHYKHRFGGSSWVVDDPTPAFGGPALLFAFDLADPLFANLHLDGLDYLPLCSYIACDVWAAPQVYQIDPGQKAVRLLERAEPATEARLTQFARGLPEKTVLIEPMTADDYPTTEELYCRAIDQFFGWGNRFIRVLGAPLWVNGVTTVTCNCGNRMIYVCGMGYEISRSYSQLINNYPVFFGEGAIYWFVCSRCFIVAVVSHT